MNRMKFLNKLDQRYQSLNICEKYYLWHLLKHFGTKWRGQTVNDIVKYYYPNSVMIKELLDD